MRRDCRLSRHPQPERALSGSKAVPAEEPFGLFLLGTVKTTLHVYTCNPVRQTCCSWATAPTNKCKTSVLRHDILW